LPALLAALHGRPALSQAGEGAAASGDTEAHSEFALLRMAALKGRASVAILGEALALPPDAVLHVYHSLCDAGLCVWVGDTLRVTASGRERLRALLAREHETADAPRASEVYGAFRQLDHELKSALTAWQVRPDGQINDHTDPDYDASVRGRIGAVHGRLMALAPRLAALSPRLAEYSSRLDRAAARIAAGARDAVARVMADSYHTVWFELHEDLLSITGLSRHDLARAGG
jgi:pyruvate,orthophosphate dikinase